MNRNIEAIILYCSNDKKFFSKCINNLLECGIKCNVISYSNFWKGEKENVSQILNDIREFNDNPNFKWWIIDWKPNKSNWFWEAYGRWYGLHKMVQKDCKYVLFIDPDEIVDTNDFNNWLNRGIYKKYISIRLKHFTYVIKPEWRVKVWAYNTILCKIDYAKKLNFKEEGRLQYWNNNNNMSRWLSKLRLNPYFVLQKGRAFVHHYTSVRTKDEMMKKVLNWGHTGDIVDWKENINNCFTPPDKNRFLKGYNLKYKLVDNKFNL